MIRKSDAPLLGRSFKPNGAGKRCRGPPVEVYNSTEISMVVVLCTVSAPHMLEGQFELKSWNVREDVTFVCGQRVKSEMRCWTGAWYQLREHGAGGTWRRMIAALDHLAEEEESQSDVA